MAIAWKNRKLMAWRDIKQRLSEEERRAWSHDKCMESLKKLEHMEYGNKEGKKEDYISKRLGI